MDADLELAIALSYVSIQEKTDEDTELAKVLSLSARQPIPTPIRRPIPAPIHRSNGPADIAYEAAMMRFYRQQRQTVRPIQPTRPVQSVRGQMEDRRYEQLIRDWQN